MKNNIIVFWNWNNSAIEKECYNTKDGLSNIYCIDQRIDIGGTLREKLKRIFKDVKNDNYLVLFHLAPRSGFGDAAHKKIKEEIEQIINQGENLKYDTFSKGVGFIYFDSSRNSGVLFSPNRALAYKLPIDGQFYSVIDSNDNIEPHYFNSLWHHYFHASKRKLFEAHQHLVRYLSAMKEYPDKNLNELLKVENNYTLKEYINERLKTDAIKEGVKEDKNAKEIMDAHEHLLSYFDENLKTHGYLTQLNQRFVNVINLIPGSIY